MHGQWVNGFGCRLILRRHGHDLGVVFAGMAKILKKFYFPMIKYGKALTMIFNIGHFMGDNNHCPISATLE